MATNRGHLLRVTAPIFEAITKLAEREGCSKAEIVRRMLDGYSPKAPRRSTPLPKQKRAKTSYTKATVNARSGTLYTESNPPVASFWGSRK